MYKRPIDPAIKSKNVAVIWGMPVGSGNNPVPNMPIALTISISEPTRPESILILFQSPIANIKARIPANIIPFVRIAMVVGVLTSGLYGNIGGFINLPPRSLIQFTVQLKFGENETERNNPLGPLLALLIAP